MAKKILLLPLIFATKSIRPAYVRPTCVRPTCVRPAYARPFGRAGTSDGQALWTGRHKEIESLVGSDKIPTCSINANVEGFLGFVAVLMPENFYISDVKFQDYEKISIA